MVSKYRAKKVVVDGIKFDSKKEARRYGVLKAMEENGEIRNLELQVKFTLIPSQYEYVAQYGKKGQRIKDKKVLVEREASYYADFVYCKDGRVIVEDTKSNITKTPEYILKRKLMLHLFGIKISEV